MDEKEVIERIERAAREGDTTLRLYNNQLTELPAEIGKLTNLTELYLYNNQLTELPAEIGKLTNLTELYLHANQLTELPAEIGKLTNLKRLDISDNKLTSLPAGILDSGLEIRWEWKDNGIILKDNPLESPPVEVVKRGTKAVRRWFEAMEEEGERRLNEVKVLLVGYGGGAPPHTGAPGRGGGAGGAGQDVVGA